ncbi:lipocalin family protein [Gordonia jinhuaensis]|uniref:Lipocalin n=1 Tax=Gordonia jinhuaensis TaxID=1517702 RepID=A0A916WWZ7_9ACTN|nr:lipocalin family protein [Gordonia jinhuaensis]GGB39012.1 lipocalin [Gordonia jinhuaensis]
MTATLAAVLSLVVGTGPAAAAGSSLPDQLKPVAHLDVDRYLGTWWQLATVPSFYGIRCAKDTNATYTLINPTTVGVDNKCTSFTGEPDGIKGQAEVVDTKTNAQLAVTFPGVPNTINAGKFPNYIVAWVADGTTPDDPYQYAIVGDPYRLSGFLLSRQKVVPTSEYLKLRTQIEKLGFNSCTFLISPITGSRSDYSPLCTL